jgi:hypothetical protein
MSSTKIVQTGMMSDLSIAKAANVSSIGEGNEWR